MPPTLLPWGPQALFLGPLPPGSSLNFTLLGHISSLVTHLLETPSWISSMSASPSSYWMPHIQSELSVPCTWEKGTTTYSPLEAEALPHSQHPEVPSPAGLASSTTPIAGLLSSSHRPTSGPNPLPHPCRSSGEPQSRIFLKHKSIHAAPWIQPFRGSSPSAASRASPKLVCCHLTCFLSLSSLFLLDQNGEFSQQFLSTWDFQG